jgi:hypothetical protein
MTYQSIVEMASNQSLLARISAALADEGYTGDPLEYARNNIWFIVSAGDWSSNWDSAQASLTVNDNPDLGMRNDVISDGMILAVVQPMVHPPA